MEINGSLVLVVQLTHIFPQYCVQPPTTTLIYLTPNSLLALVLCVACVLPW